MTCSSTRPTVQPPRRCAPSLNICIGERAEYGQQLAARCVEVAADVRQVVAELARH